MLQHEVCDGEDGCQWWEGHHDRYDRCILGRVDREVGPGTEGREMAVADVAEVVRASGGMFQGCRCRLVSYFVAYDANVGLSFLKGYVCPFFTPSVSKSRMARKRGACLFTRR